MSSLNFRNKQEHLDYLEAFKINQKRALFTIILCILLDSFGYSMVLPLLPGIAKVFQASDLMIGILMSSNAFSALIFIPIWGKLSDRYGRKPILLISQAGTAFSFFILGLSNSYYFILLGRILDGMFGGQMPAIRAYITDVTTPETRASHLGKIMVGYTGGMIVGPILGGSLGIINWRLPFLVASGLSVLTIFLTKRILVESMPKERREEIRKELFKNLGPSRKQNSIWNGEIISRFAQTLLVSLIASMFMSSYALVLNKRYGADASVIGYVMAVAGVGLLIYGLIVIRPLLKKFGEKRTLKFMFVLAIVLFLIYPYLFDFWMVFPFVLGFAFMLSIMRPLISTNITKAVDPNRQGEVSGLAFNIRSLAQVIAPLISTSFLQIGGLTIAFIHLDSYELIGFMNMILAIILLIIGYLDINQHPNLYFYERIRRKKETIRKRRIQEKQMEQELKENNIVE
ncbi:MAG: MFS transporter [Candidatus Thorarchaeota archaeon]